MKQLIFFIFFISTATCFAQKQYSIGLNFSTRMSRQMPQYYFYDQIHDQKITQRLNGIGVKLLKFSKRRLFLETGLNYLQSTVFLRHVPDARYVYDQDGNPIDIEIIGDMHVVERRQYLSFPLLINYLLFNSEGTNIYLVGGLLLDWLYHGKNTYLTRDGIRSATLSNGLAIEKLNKVLRVGAGFFQPLGSNFILLVSPSINYEFVNEIERRDNFSSIGIDLQLHYKL